MLAGGSGGMRELRTEYFIISIYLLLRHLLKFYVWEKAERELFRQFTLDFHQRWNDDKESDSDIQSFSNKRQQSAAEIQVRHQIIRQAFFDYAKTKDLVLKTKDDRRAFNEAERIAIYRKENGRCSICVSGGQARQGMRRAVVGVRRGSRRPACAWRADRHRQRAIALPIPQPAKGREGVRIAVLGWGSLIWDRRDLPIVREWQHGGPVLPIEFSRISSDGRLTLVIDEEHGTDVPTRFARTAGGSLTDAIDGLWIREGRPSRDRIGFVNLVSDTEQDWSRQRHPAACDRIKAWARAQNWEAVVWTALISNFSEKRGEPFSTEAAARYFSDLTGETRIRAAEYVEKAPEEVDTPFRRLVAAAARPQ